MTRPDRHDLLHRGVQLMHPRWARRAARRAPRRRRRGIHARRGRLWHFAAVANGDGSMFSRPSSLRSSVCPMPCGNASTTAGASSSALAPTTPRGAGSPRAPPARHHSGDERPRQRIGPVTLIDDRSTTDGTEHEIGSAHEPERIRVGASAESDRLAVVLDRQALRPDADCRREAVGDEVARQSRT